MQYCDRQNVFDLLLKSDIRRYGNTEKTAIGQGDDYTTCCLLVYPFFKKNYRLIAIHLSKSQACDTDPKVMQQHPILELARPI